MPGQGMMSDQAAHAEPVNQVADGSRVRDVLEDMAKHLARGRQRVKDRLFDGVTGSAVHGLDPVAGARDRDPPILLHGDHGGQRHPFLTTAQVGNLVHVQAACRRQHLPAVSRYPGLCAAASAP
jgi:hypothetical protein